MKLHIPGMDERPRIEGDLSSMAEVIEYYKEHGPNVPFQRGFHVVMDKLVDPHVTYAPADPNDTNKLIHDMLQDGLYRARANRRQGAPLSPLGKTGALAAAAVGATAAYRLSQRS